MYTLDTLVDIVNSKLDESGIENTVNSRLVRHYTSNKSIPPAYKDGKEARYDDTHVDALVSLRSSQSAGISSKALKTLSQSSLTQTEYSSQAAALSFLNDLANTPLVSSYRNSTELRSSGGVTTKPFQNMTCIPAAAVHDTWTRYSLSDGFELNVRQDKQLHMQQLNKIKEILKGD